VPPVLGHTRYFLSRIRNCKVMRHSLTATVTSSAVLAITLSFYAYAASLVPRGPHATYLLHAVFMSSDGLAPGADVRVAGVKIGSVQSIKLDPDQFVSNVTFAVERGYQLPTDTSLSVSSSGFTSAPVLVVDPGRRSGRLVPGATIRDTHALVSLEDSVSQYIFGAGGLGESPTR